MARRRTPVWFPAAEKGLSRRYAADNLSVEADPLAELVGAGRADLGVAGARVVQVADARGVLERADAGLAPLAATYFNMRKTTIYGGSNEVQRNIVSQVVLG